jgi:hypothetical protein
MDIQVEHAFRTPIDITRKELFYIILWLNVKSTEQIKSNGSYNNKERALDVISIKLLAEANPSNSSRPLRRNLKVQ